MDWNFAIEKHKAALMRVLAMLVGMAGLTEATLPGTVYFFPPKGDAASMPGAGGKKVNCPQRVLPRHLHRAILRLLRPAEAAARRLIVVAARGLTVQLATPRKPKLAILPKGSAGTGIVDAGIAWRQLGLANFVPPVVRKPRDPDRLLALPLTDTLRGLPRRRRFAPTSVPRICGSGTAARHRIPQRRPKSPNDPLDAGRLHRRLAAIACVLDDLPAQAKRLAHWRARRDRARARGAFHRLIPMRPGRPPGWRKPDTPRAHEVHRVLDDVHGLAFWALEQKNDTS